MNREPSFDPELSGKATMYAVELIQEGRRDFIDVARAIARRFDLSLEELRWYVQSAYEGARYYCRDGLGVDVADCTSRDDIVYAMGRMGRWFDDIEDAQIEMQWQEQPSAPTEDDLRALMGLALTAPTPDAIMNFTGFAWRFRRFAPFNIQMIYAQRPGAGMVASKREWAAMGRQVRPGAIPIIVLRPLGPIAYVFEELDTDPPRPRSPDNDMFGARGAFDEKRLDTLIDKLAKADERRLVVRVRRRDFGANLAGWITGGPMADPTEPMVARLGAGGGQQERSVWDVTINQKLAPAEQFVTLLHELGHLFCGHLGAFRDGNRERDEYGWPDRRGLPLPAQEIEAELVAWWLAEREGLITGSPLYLRPHLEQAGTAISAVDLDRVTRAVSRIRSYLGDR